MSENVVILGATSGIARALAHVLSRRGCRLVLAGRSRAELEKVAGDLHIRYGADCHVEPFDALDFDGHPAFFQRCLDHFGGDLMGVVLCFGYMTEQAKAQTDLEEARRTVDVNFTSAVSLLSLAANELERRRAGYIAAVSSVAGDRGRQSNYIYGSAKAGLSAFLEGLRNRLFRAGVHVLTVKPGFTDTPMTHGLVDPGSPLVASPERVARDIDRAIRARKDEIYTPWFWGSILVIIRSIPGPLFKRMLL
jgi:short-subunit dehydrogenase